MGLLGDIFGVAGSIVGSVLAVPVAIIATTLGITTEMAQKALDSGCKTYEEIRNFHGLD